MTKQHDLQRMMVELLSHMSGSKEVRTYLNRFSGVAADRFAVIKIGGAIIEEELEATASALAFLHQMGLTPVVIHGGGPQLDLALKARGIETEKRDGLRVTSPDVLDVARDVFLAQNLKLVEAIRQKGVEAHTLNSGVIDAAFKDRENLGYVGSAKGIQQNLIRSVINSGAIPIMTCLGVAAGGQIVNINGDEVVSALVHALQPMRIIFLTGTGGLLDSNDELVSSINLTTDYEYLMSRSWVQGGMRVKMEAIKSLLDDLPLDSSISMTRPKELIKELFTHGGAGTNIRRGEAVLTYSQKAEIDDKRLLTLVEDGFRRPLKSDWWSSLALDKAVISEGYRVAALVSRLDVAGRQVQYLDKFAVAESARGEGLAKVAWQKLTSEEPLFFLRSRTENSFNEFYSGNADGAIKRGGWTVFWKGDIDLISVAPIVDHIANLPESFEGNGP